MPKTLKKLVKMGSIVFRFEVFISVITLILEKLIEFL